MISLFREKKPIPLDRYFQLVKPKYAYIKITPHKSNRNNKSDNIAKAVTHTFKTLDKQIRIEQKKIWIETSFKISYIIDIQGGNANFYFLVPEVFESILLEKIAEIWSKATVEKVESIKSFNLNSTNYQLAYKNEDALSLTVNKSSNEPLNSILSVMEIMKDDDRVTLIYNFIPRSQFGWLKQYDDTMLKIKENKPIEREKLSLKYISKYTLSALSSLFDALSEILCDLMGGNRKVATQTFSDSLAQALQQSKVITEHTKAKKTQRVLECQIAVTSDSSDKTREDNNAVSVCQAFRVLDGDNELMYKKAKPIEDVTQFKLNGYEVNTISTDEAQNFIQQPARGLLKQFNIKHIQTEEIQVPSKLKDGFFSLGSVKYKGSNVESFLENEYNIGNLPLVLIGAQGSGKTTFIQNIASNCNRNKEGIFLLDFIKNCSMSEDIIKVTPKEDLVVLNLADEADIQGFGYNEINVTQDMSVFKRLELASLQSQQVMALIDSISVGDPLSSRMRRFLNSACNVVFSQGNASIKNVIDCVENHLKRKAYIESLEGDLKDALEDDINTLKELDELSKATKDNPSELIGTRESKIEHILDRVSMLREDFKLKYMYNKVTTNNINLVELMEQGKTVIIQMKESDFPTKMVKNILVTYWISKIWLASQLRGSLNESPLRCNVIIDEVFQAPTCMKNLEYILPQSRKFGCKFIFSTQYIRQLEDIFDTLEASGSSYMLLKGSMEDDFNHFKNKLESFEYEDLRDMEKYHSLNLIYYSGGYASFISKLPQPLKASA